MKYFICPLGGISLGIPGEQTERLIPINRTQTAVVERENQEIFLSLPALFRSQDLSAPHGLVIKSESPVKPVLLAPKVENELELVEKNIHPPSESLLELSQYVSGICFVEEKPILIIDPARLIKGLT